MEQRCHLSMVWLTWLGLPALAGLLGYLEGWMTGLAILAFGILAQVGYVRWFPLISRWIGYGPVADEPAVGPAGRRGAMQVTLYTANVCPFCPLIRSRLLALRDRLGFEFVEVDVTFRPHLARAKGLQSVPVVEAGGRFLVGNATTARLASFLTEEDAPEERTARHSLSAGGSTDR